MNNALLYGTVEFKAIQGYKNSNTRTIIMWVLVIITGGLFGLALLWSRRIQFQFKEKCNLDEATVFLIRTLSDKYQTAHPQQYEARKFFEFQCKRYIWDTNDFKPAPEDPPTWSHEYIAQLDKGLKNSSIGVDTRLRVGKNVIEVPLKPLHEELLSALLSPVNTYQYFCCILWILHEYAVYALVLAITVIAAGCYDVYRVRRNRLDVREMASYEVDVEVNRDGEWQIMSSEELIPGDIISIPNYRFKIPCDLAVISGMVVVDESSLTGESIPAIKQPPQKDPHKTYNPSKDKRHTLYSGTIVLSSVPAPTPNVPVHSVGSPILSPSTTTTNVQFMEKHGISYGRVTAVVARTGFKTAKGQLIRSILFLKPKGYSYEREAKIFLGIMAGIGGILFFIALYLWGAFRSDIPYDSYRYIYAFEIITILVPAQLPLIFRVGLIFGAKSLEKEGIFTTDSSRIPISGKIGVMCFDKTGTLTKPELEVVGILPVSKKESAPVTWKGITSVSAKSEKVFHLLATCHGLSELGSIISDENSENKIPQYTGPVLDIKLFEATKLVYFDAQPGKCEQVLAPDNSKLEILRRFDFDHVTQRMSVIVRDPEVGNCFAYMKGSIESVSKCCAPKSLPKDWRKKANFHAKRGYYVIAMAYRAFTSINFEKAMTIKRDEIEKEKERDMIFLGLALLRNELKDDTAAAIAEVQSGNIRPVIITGDNVYTAIYIAKKCGIISQNKEVFVGDVIGDLEVDIDGESRKKGDVVFRHMFDSYYTIDPESFKLTEEDDENSSEKEKRKSETEPEEELAGDEAHLDDRKIIKKGTETYMNPATTEIAVTAEAFDLLISRGRTKILSELVTVFARMKPGQKEQAINIIRESKKIVGMCGDGANDCAALTAAHCGIALSQEEASIVSAFSAKSLSISAVPALIRQGRASLTNSFGAFKFTVLYSFIETIQAFICYYFSSDMSTGQYVLIDFIFIIPISFFIVRGIASDRLSRGSPTAKVFSGQTLGSVIGYFVISLLTLLIPYALLNLVPGYVPHMPGGLSNLVNGTYDKTRDPGRIRGDKVAEVLETSVAWFLGIYLYAAVGLAVSFGGSFRKPIWYNYGIITTCFFVLFSGMFIMFMPPSWDPLEILRLAAFIELPPEARAIVMTVGLIGFFLILIYEKVVVTGPVAQYIRTHFRRKQDDTSNNSANGNSSATGYVSVISSEAIPAEPTGLLSALDYDYDSQDDNELVEVSLEDY